MIVCDCLDNAREKGWDWDWKSRNECGNAACSQDLSSISCRVRSQPLKEQLTKGMDNILLLEQRGTGKGV
jgi:hypothetical protein